MGLVLGYFLDQIWTSFGAILGANLSSESAQERQDAPNNANMTSLVPKIVHLQKLLKKLLVFKGF